MSLFTDYSCFLYCCL